MMLIAQLDKVVEVSQATIDPMPNVMHVRELGVCAAGEPATLVTPPDLQTLGVARVPAGSPEVQAPAIGPVR